MNRSSVIELLAFHVWSKTLQKVETKNTYIALLDIEIFDPISIQLITTSINIDKVVRPVLS